MKHTNHILIIALGILAVACDDAPSAGTAKSEDAKTARASTPVETATDKKPTAPAKAPAKPKVPVLAEMKQFMGSLGTSKKVAAALGKHGVKGLDTKDMQLYDLKTPRITQAWVNKGFTCYSIAAKAGMTTRLYNLCWSDGKIQAVVDKGMAPAKL